jgi:hypothetical protein
MAQVTLPLLAMDRDTKDAPRVAATEPTWLVCIKAAIWKPTKTIIKTMGK